MDMPPLTPPDRPLNRVYWHILLLAACVLVFAFALHAKVAVYGHAQPQPSTAAKLWTNGEKFQAPTAPRSPVQLWLAAFLTWLFVWTSRHDVAMPVLVARERASDRYLHRFLRPPPRS
jgi:hypothetical protein